MSVFRRFSRKDHSIEKDEENHSDKGHKKNKLSSKKRSKKGGSIKQGLQECALGLKEIAENPAIYKEVDKEVKRCANTVEELPQTEKHEKSIERTEKPSSKSNGELIECQRDSSGSGSGTEAIYHELNFTLNEESTDEDEDDTQYSPIHAKTFELPSPLEGERYAFDEIREILQPINRDALLNLDLNDICDKHKLKWTDESEGFAAINLLRQYLQQK